MTTRGCIIAGTQSGSGKTTVTLGIMAALQRSGFSLTPFKCGPDFIDPSLHQRVTGKVSRNLDLWMSSASFVHQIFTQHSASSDISVVEGVMGMFDGDTSSTAALAEALDLPVILVLDVRSSAESCAAVLKGFETLNPKVAPKGVILNMVGSERHLMLARNSIERHCQAEVLGYLPRTLDFTIPSRHLGLHMGDELPIDEEQLDNLARTILDHINIDRLVTLSQCIPKEILQPVSVKKPVVRIGVARDRAFCFYYEDNLDLLRAAGAELIFFSPLADSSLPPGLDGLYLGGGYPELYGKPLAGNQSMIESTRQFADSGKPIYAECGGFMYLCQGITDLEDNTFLLTGIFPTMAHMQKRRASLGYRELVTTSPSFFGPAGRILRGHEFHYSHIDPLDNRVERLYRVNGEGTEGYRIGNVLGGYMHLHFGFCPDALHSFIQTCKG